MMNLSQIPYDELIRELVRREVLVHQEISKEEGYEISYKAACQNVLEYIQDVGADDLTNSFETILFKFIQEEQE